MGKITGYIIKVQMPNVNNVPTFYAPQNEIARYMEKLNTLCEELQLQNYAVAYSGTIDLDSSNFFTPFDELKNRLNAQLPKRSEDTTTIVYKDGQYVYDAQSTIHTKKR